MSSPDEHADVLVPLALLRDRQLTSSDALCWIWLASLPPGTSPTRREIAAVFGVHPDQATRWLRNLQSAGWISRQPRWAAAWHLEVHRTPTTR